MTGVGLGNTAGGEAGLRDSVGGGVVGKGLGCVGVTLRVFGCWLGWVAALSTGAATLNKTIGVVLTAVFAGVCQNSTAAINAACKRIARLILTPFSLCIMGVFFVIDAVSETDIVKNKVQKTKNIVY
jgi:hypothetical protein